MVSRPRKQGRKQHISGRRTAATGIIPHPPQLRGFEVTYSKTLRFIASTAQALSISYQNLLDLILMTTSATAPFDVFKMVKMRGVKVWAIPVIGQTTSVTVVFDGVTAGSQGDRKVHTDTSMGIEPAFISARPLVKTLASMFQISSGAECFFLDCPAGAVIDVMLDFKSDTLGTAVAAQFPSVASTVGIIAFRGLDGLALASSGFTVPAGLNQI